MLKAFYLAFLACLTSTGFAQTIINAGNLSGTWTKAASPYVVTGEVVVQANQKLIIQPGVEVRFSGSYGLLVNGSLVAVGTQVDSIKFTVTDKNVGWDGIRFQDVAHTDSSKLIYTIIEYSKPSGTDNYGGAILNRGLGKLAIRNSTLRNNVNEYGGAIGVIGVTGFIIRDVAMTGNRATAGGGGVYARNSTVIIKRSRILGSVAGGALTAEFSKVEIHNSTLAGNNGGSDAINLFWSELKATNSIFWNSAGEFHNSTATDISLDYCIVKGVVDPQWNATNCISTDPLFVNLSKFDVRLSWNSYPYKGITTSPAIDGGDPTSAHDPDGTISDIGALTYNQDASAPPTVSFQTNDVRGGVPYSVTFTNLSTQAHGQIVSWLWDFGDNTTSTEKNPVHVYTTPGVYDVNLVAKNQSGIESLLLRRSYIKALAGTIINTETVEGTWTKANSPYNIYNSVTVPAGKKLTIEPGVEVTFFGRYTFKVNGSLSARGTVTDSIAFDWYDDKSAWHSLRIEDVDPGTDSTILEYCRIAHTYYNEGDVTTNGGNALHVLNFDKVRISHSLLQFNQGGRGAGVYADHSSIKINDNVIRYGLVAQYGGGIYVLESSPIIRNNKIYNNYGESGGGIAVYTGNSIIENNVISYNSCYWNGAGVLLSDFNGTFKGNIVSYNESGHDDGGGLSINNSSARFINNTISFNKAEEGEGIYVSGGGAPAFINNIIYHNRDRYDDVNTIGDVYLMSSGNPTFEYCDIEGAIETYLPSQNFKVIGCISQPPLFTNAATNDLSLRWDDFPLYSDNRSRCIDAGSLETPHDPDGSRTDIGALYYHQVNKKFPPRVDFAADTLLGFNTLVVHFKDVTDPGNAELTTWQWTFGDGATSTEQNPSHEYTAEGRYDVSLIVTDANGLTRSFSRKKYIRIMKGIYIKGKIEGVLDQPRYLVGKDLLVDEQKTLQISAGTELVFMGPYELRVLGSLKAKGTKASPIVFTLYDTTGLDLEHAVESYGPAGAGWKGIYVYASGNQDSTIIDHCKIHFVENNGTGAIYAFSNNGAKGMRISNSEISYNSTQGIFIWSSSLIIRNNYIHHNYCSGYAMGAGLYCSSGDPKIINNIISNNEAESDGGGIAIYSSSPLFVGNTITHNKASRGGGISNYYGGSDFINNTIAYNTSKDSRGGGYFTLSYTGYTKFTNTIIAQNLPAQVDIASPYTSTGFRNSILEGGKEGIAGYTTLSFYENMIVDNPNIASNEAFHGRTLATSPGIDGGLSTSEITSKLPAFDVMGNPRIKNSKVDIGAYEYEAEGSITAIGTVTDLERDEDFEPYSIPLSTLFDYEDDSRYLSFTIDNAASINLYKVNAANGSLYFSPLKDRFGSQQVNISASNGVASVSTSLTFHIEPIRDLIEFTLEGDLVLEEDFVGTRPYGIYFTPPFGEDQYKFSFDSDEPDFVNAVLTPGGKLTLAAIPETHGSGEYTITSTNGDLKYSQSFSLEVASVNDAPIITIDTAKIILALGQLTELPWSVTDAEGDLITLTVTSPNSFATFTNESVGEHHYNLKIGGNKRGTTSISISASDGKLTSTSSVSVVVSPISGIEDSDVAYKVYPNPTLDYLIVRGMTGTKLKMHNTIGALLVEANMTSEEHRLDLTNLSDGIYLLNVDDGIKLRVYKIVKR